MTNYGSSHEKWKGTEYLRELPAAISIARKGSRDESALQSKKLAEELLNRRSKRYFHLDTLIKDRLSDDVREVAGDRRWLNSLTSGSEKVLKENRDKNFNLGRIRAASAIISLHSRRIQTKGVSSLSDISLDVIARNLSSFEVRSLRQMFVSLPPQMTETLSFLCAQYQTIDDDNLECLASTHAQYLMFGESITDVGLTNFVTSSRKVINEDLDDGKDWWETAIESYEVCFNNSLLRELTLMGCKISFKGFAQLRQHFRNLELLVVHSVSFKYGFESSEDPFCVVFNKIFSGWPFLRELHLSYCPWVTIDALETLIGSFRHGNKITSNGNDFRKLQADEDFLPAPVQISKIVVTGIYDNENIAIIRVQNLISSFQKYCNIDLIVTI